MDETCSSPGQGLPPQLGQAAEQHICQKLNRKPLEVRIHGRAGRATVAGILGGCILSGKTRMASESRKQARPGNCLDLDYMPPPQNLHREVGDTPQTEVEFWLTVCAYTSD